MEEEQVLSAALEQQSPMDSAEKMLSTAEVKKIAAREKAEGIARGRREAEEQYKRQLEEIGQNQNQRNAEVPREADVNAMYQQVQERFNKEMQERALQNEMSQIANNYLARVEAGRKNYNDFDEITKGFDPSAFPQLVYLVAGLENAGDIIYDLSKNPSKLVTLNALAEKTPEFARVELQKLSQSINSNREASQEASGQNVNQPLDQLQPSRVSAGNNGKMSIRDLRNQPWLKG